MSYFRMLFCFLACGSCFHDPDFVRDVDTSLTDTGSAGGAQVGIDSENRMVVQIQKELDEELRSVLWLNSQMLFEVKYLISRLKSCLVRYGKREEFKHKLASLDLSSVKEMELREREEEIGRNSDGEVKLISKEGYTQRLKEERSARKNLILLKETLNDELRQCEY